jgi:perosamine synthetase
MRVMSVTQSQSPTETWSDVSCCFPFIKGRVALYAILRAAGIGEGDEVLVPGFTCFVVAAAIGYVGAKAVYYDIDPATYNGDPRKAAERIGPTTRAVIVQHTFGVPMELGDLPARCHEQGVLLIEDCAHAMGATASASAVGTLGDAAFASLQWSKPVTTGLGGLARVNSAELGMKLDAVYRRDIIEPSWRKSYSLAVLSSAYNRWFRPSWYWRARTAYHWLSDRGLLHGSSVSAEFTKPSMPPRYRERFGSPRTRQLRRVLSDLPRQIEHRERIAGIYMEWCRENGLFTQHVARDCRPAFLRFPLLVEGREELLAAAQAEKLEIGDWMNAPLHPREANARIFGYQAGDCPIADLVAKRVINLPTHRHITKRDASRILAFLEKYEDRIARNPVRVIAP